jgi:hypothetical protein
MALGLVGLVFGEDFFEFQFDAMGILRIGKFDEFIDLLIYPME